MEHYLDITGIKEVFGGPRGQSTLWVLAWGNPNPFLLTEHTTSAVWTFMRAATSAISKDKSQNKELQNIERQYSASLKKTSSSYYFLFIKP